MIRAFWVPVGLVALLLVAASLIAPFNHDEDQYYAAGHSLSHGRLYFDFIYLQTPLHALFGNALIEVWPGNSLWLLRVSQALIGAVIFALVLRENLRAAASVSSASFGALLMVSSYSFLFASTVYRNDILPTLLATIAIIALAREAQRNAGHWLGWLTAGLFLGLAASAKANFLVLAAAPLAWLLLVPGPAPAERLRWLLGFAAGGIVGAAPTLIPLLCDPEKFLWQVVRFGVQGPLDWYGQIGQGNRLELPGRLSDSLLILLQGPALAALGLLLIQKVVRRSPDHGKGRALLLDLFILGGLVAAFLPNPAWRQYFVAPLPALFLRLPDILDGMPKRRQVAASTLLLISALVGMGAFAALLGKSAKDPDRLIVTRWRESKWIGERLQSEAAGGPVASLSPHLLLDSGAVIHPRFASGVFVYRWRGRDEEILSMGGATPRTLASAFAACPPRAIVTGYESGKGNAFSVDLEAPLRAYAARAGYKALQSPFGRAVLYVNPQPSRCRLPTRLARG